MRIMVIHNTLPEYRLPLFKRLLEKYDTLIVLTHPRARKELASNNQHILTSSQIKMLRNHFGFAIGLLKVLIFENYDICIIGCCSNLYELIETIIAYLILKIKRKKIIIWSEIWREPKKKSRKIGIYIMRYLLSNADGYIVPGSRHKKFWVKFMNIPPEKITIAPNASEFSEFLPTIYADIRKKYNIPHSKKIILYLGRIIKTKGVDYLIEAFKKLETERDDVFLLICGDGGYKDFCIKLSENLKVRNILFTGFIQPRDRHSFFSQCDIFVLPTISEGNEAWGLVVNEAMHFGKPIIVTNAVGAAHDMVHNNHNGFIVNDQDVESLYRAMRLILSEPKIKKKFGYFSKKIVTNKFTYTTMLNGFIKIIERVMV